MNWRPLTKSSSYVCNSSSTRAVLPRSSSPSSRSSAVAAAISHPSAKYKATTKAAMSTTKPSVMKYAIGERGPTMIQAAV